MGKHGFGFGFGFDPQAPHCFRHNLKNEVHLEGEVFRVVLQIGSSSVSLQRGTEQSLLPLKAVGQLQVQVLLLKIPPF